MAGRSNSCDFRKRSGNSVALSAGSRRDGLGLERSLGCAAALSGLLLLDKMSLGILVGAEEVSDLLGKSSLKLLLKIDQLLLKHKACYYKSNSGRWNDPRLCRYYQRYGGGCQKGSQYQSGCDGSPWQAFDGRRHDGLRFKRG